MGRRAKKGGIIQSNHLKLAEIEPLTKAQLEVFESDRHLLLHGCAGTGKTFISLYLALDDLEKRDYEKIIIIRSAVPTRKIGFLPGTDKEKAQVYEEPYIEMCAELCDRGDAYPLLKDKGAIEFKTTSYIRGTTFNDAVIIVDECQNMTFHELDSIITRVGLNCRIVFCGDFFQSDLEDTGINQFMPILREMQEFDFIEFGTDDIVRSDLVKNYLVTKYRLQGD